MRRRPGQPQKRKPNKASRRDSRAVATMGQSADGSYQQWQMQMLFDKLDELINALRR